MSRTFRGAFVTIRVETAGRKTRKGCLSPTKEGIWKKGGVYGKNVPQRCGWHMAAVTSISLRDELRRMAGGLSFHTSILLTTAACMVSTAILLPQREFGAAEVVQQIYAGTGSADLILRVIPILPYALSYAMDTRDGAVLFWMVRKGVKKYARDRFITSCAGAFIATVTGMILFALILFSMGHPLCNVEYYAAGSGAWYPYTALLGDGRYLLFFLTVFSSSGMSAAMVAASAIMISGVAANVYLVLPAPLCLYLISLRLASSEKVMFGMPWLYPAMWMEDTWILGTWWETFLVRFGVCLLVCTMCGWLCCVFMKKRWIQ